VQIKSKLTAFRLFQYFQHAFINLGAYNRWLTSTSCAKLKLRLFEFMLVNGRGSANQASSPAVPVAQEHFACVDQAHFYSRREMDSVILRLPFVKLPWPNAAATQFVVSRMNHEFAFAICYIVVKIQPKTDGMPVAKMYAKTRGKTLCLSP
jgi:hypothetical protein